MTAVKSAFYILNENGITDKDSIAIDFGHVLVDYFNNHPGFQRIAWYNGGTGGGFNSYGFSDAIKDQSWFVYRAVSASIPYDLAFKISTSSYSSTNGQWKTTDDLGIGIVAAWHSSSIAWNGTTSNNGSDSFTASLTAPWKSGSKTTLRINGPSGTHATTKNGLLRIYDPTLNGPIGVLITGDNDGTVIHTITQREAGVSTVGTNKTYYIGTYNPVTSSMNVPLCSLEFIRADENEKLGTTFDYTGGGLIYSSNTETLGFNIGGTGTVNSSYRINEKNNSNFENTAFVVEHPIMLTCDLLVVGSERNASRPKFFGILPLIRFVGYHGYSLRFYNNGSKITVFNSNAQGTYSIDWVSSSVGATDLNRG